MAEKKHYFEIKKNQSCHFWKFFCLQNYLIIFCQIEFMGLSPAEHYWSSQKPFRKRRQERMEDGMENLGKVKNGKTTENKEGHKRKGRLHVCVSARLPAVNVCVCVGE